MDKKERKLYFLKDRVYFFVFSDDVMAVLKLDHQQVVQTSWKPTSQQCWDHRASIDLDRVCQCSSQPQGFNI